MAHGGGMDAFHAADDKVLPVFIKQHAAIETETIRCGADFHGQVAAAGNAFALNIKGRFTRVCFKERCERFNIQHCLDTLYQKAVLALRGGYWPVPPLLNIIIEAGEADGPYSLPSQSSCREGGAQGGQAFCTHSFYRINRRCQC